MPEISWISWIPLISATISFVGLLAVFVQLRRGTKQRESQSLVQILDINRQLLTLGFSNPDLIRVLHDATDVDPMREEHYLQLWFNQMWLIHLFLGQSTFNKEIKEPLLCAMEEMTTLANFRRLWQRKRMFYSASFREFVDAFIEKKELSVERTAPECLGG